MILKKFVCMLLFMALPFALSTAAYSVNIDQYYEDSLEASGADELSEQLSDDTKTYLDKLGCSEIEFEKILDISPKTVLKLLWDIFKNGVNEPLKATLKATGIVLLVSVCSGFFPDDEKSKSVMNLICGCITVIGIFVPAIESVRAAVSAIGVCADFEKALIPVLAGVVTASGNPALALTFKGAAFAAAEFIESIASNFALPLIGISGALGITGAMLPTLRLSAISELMRKTMTTVLTCATGLFTGFLSLKSVLASSADSFVVKGVRMASSFVPVVGGALGEAYTTVSASLSLLKSTIGIYAVIVFFVIGVPVVINLAMWVFAMRLACSVSELLDCRVCSEILRTVAYIFSMTNVILILCMAVFIISSGLVVSVKSGG
ncbi:MAG: hypothetical protein E7547_03750 [Ruminococcaceae bacterium]|nr:hypothetical protein [Oscillospiraceae bacterium]